MIFDGHYFLWLMVLLFAACLAVDGEPEDENFKAFLENALQNYSSWLVSNNYDPVKVPATVNMTQDMLPLYSFTGELWNQTLSGNSNLEGWSVTSDLNRTSFDVHVHMTEYIVRAEYSVFGSAIEIPVTGHGSVNITTEGNFGGGGRPNISLHFLDVPLNDAGYVNLSTAGMLYSDPVNFRGDWENLEAGDSQSLEIAKLALTGLVYKDNGLRTLPLRKHLYDFLQEVFYSTTFDDIISGRGIL